MTETFERVKARSTKTRRTKAMDKVSITITTDKPVKIRVTPDDGSDGEVEAKKEAEGLNKLLNAVKGGRKSCGS
jgi:hypothetical protein